MILAAAALLLSVPDPAGDVRGDGSYALPSGLVGGVERSLDVRELRAVDSGGRLRLEVGMGGLDDPWGAPGGFSAAVVDVFVKTDYGGRRALDGTGLNAPAGQGWHRRYRLSGFETRVWAADGDGNVRELPSRAPVRAEGSTLVLDTDLPAGQYGYWVTSRIYSPFARGGALEPRAGAAGEAQLASARPGEPAAVDVLQPGGQQRAYLTRVLPPVGELLDRRPLSLLYLSGAALLLAVLATTRAWRRG